MRDQIVNAMAKLAWALAWSEHADEHGCCRTSGMEIFDIMPQETPEVSMTYAVELAAKIEHASGAPLDALFKRASEVDPTVDNDDIDMFGEYLVYAAQGCGVAWTDDHEEVPGLVVPYHDDYESRVWADEHCAEDGKNIRAGCGHYVKPRYAPGVCWSRCPDCGSTLFWIGDGINDVVHYVPDEFKGWARKLKRGQHWTGRKYAGAVRRFLRACKAA